jgi:2-polyprenyl-3-methyl-5-hydroxy-6-metoxy-1,4-benzoquinol methylase
MRYGPIADDAFEEAMLASSVAPLALFDSFIPLVQASALMVGVRHGVFEGLRGGPCSAAELGGQLGVDPETLQLLMRVLSASGYLQPDPQDRFELTEVARTTLLDDSTDRLTAWVAMNEMWWSRFAQMGTVLHRGQGLDLHAELADPTEWSTYQAAMLENARRFAPFVAAMVPVKPGATRLLDIAGSHGLYGALIARAHPPMRSEVLDLPQAVDPARRLASDEGLDDVVTYRAGDALADDLGADYDVVFVGNILHHFAPQQINALLTRTRAALSRSGTIAIWEVRRPEDDDPRPDLIGDAFALFFRMTSTARCYTVTEFTGWLTDTGFTDVQVQALPVGRSLVLVTGRTP